MKLTVRILCPVLFLILLGFTCGIAGYRINLTGSMPVGIWKESTVLQRGSSVAACVPPNSSAARIASERGYISPGQCPGGFAPLLKPITALPGDTVILSDEAISINGRWIPNSRTQAIDSQGRPLPSFPRGIYPVLTGEYWLFATDNPNSFDSRYFGPVPESSIVSSLVPIATFHTNKLGN
jgi:conjugative transfer signal peptidase TraF